MATVRGTERLVRGSTGAPRNLMVAPNKAGWMEDGMNAVHMDVYKKKIKGKTKQEDK